MAQSLAVRLREAKDAGTGLEWPARPSNDRTAISPRRRQPAPLRIRYLRGTRPSCGADRPPGNVRRLSVIYGANYALKLQSAPGEGTSARIEIPELLISERASA